MWPRDRSLRPGPDGIYDQDEVRAEIWQKPIEQIEAGDLVVSFDKNANLVPGHVLRTMINKAKIVIDFFGTFVTPGHVYHRADSGKAGTFEPLIDILRDDGAIRHQDGTPIRAATGSAVGDPLDRFVWAIVGDAMPDGSGVRIKEKGRIRLGTRVIVDRARPGGGEGGRRDFCIADLIEAGGGTLTEDGLIRVDDGPAIPFHWTFTKHLPNPEDYVLKRSGTKLEEIYKASEWEAVRPRLPAPMAMDGGPIQPLSGAELSAMPRNTPLSLDPTGPVALPRGGQNRKRRKALEAERRKTAKAHKQALN